MMATTHALVAEDIAKAYGAGKIATSVLNGLSSARVGPARARGLGP